MRCKQVKAAEWVKPKRKYYYMQCCDCKLIHKLEFNIIKDSLKRCKIIFRAWRVTKKQLKSSS